MRPLFNTHMKMLDIWYSLQVATHFSMAAFENNTGLPTLVTQVPEKCVTGVCSPPLLPFVEISSSDEHPQMEKLKNRQASIDLNVLRVIGVDGFLVGKRLFAHQIVWI